MDGASEGGRWRRAARERHGANSNRTPHSRSGCATCRRRRVRCDERKDTCGNCARLKLRCAWYDPAELAQRSRVNTACERCRTKKIRCTSAWSTGPCDPCQTAGTTCINTKGRTGSFSTAPTASPTAGPSGGALCEVREQEELCLPDRDGLRRLLDAYFDGPHYYCFYTFIHQPTLMQMFDSDAVPEYLLLILVATSLHFLEPYNKLPDLWADESRRLVMAEVFSPPSTTTLQAMLLLQRYEWHRASHIGAWFLSGIAVRLAHGLQLHIEILDKARVPTPVRETRRRLTWSCFVMESMIEAGRNPLSGIDASTIEVKVPCNERSFQLGLETDMPGVDHLTSRPFNETKTTLNHDPHLSTPDGRPGISAFLVKLAALRRDILDYTLPYHPRNNGHIPLAMPWDHDSCFPSYEEKLDQWRLCLPEELQFNPEVMYTRRSQLVSFVTLQCLFHGCYCDLYRIGSYLTASRRLSNTDTQGLDPPSSFFVRCRHGRLQHAFEICKVISDSMEHHTRRHDPVVGISAALAMRVLVIERQPEDSMAIGLTDEAVYTYLDAAVRCAKEIARCSVPIRELFCSVCELAHHHGYHVDLSGISSAPKPGTHTAVTHQKLEEERAPSPSLRTYGTFGSIQNSLAMRKDLLAPPASGSSEKESDLFTNFGTLSSTSQSAHTSLPHMHEGMPALPGSSWSADSSFFPFQSFSPSDPGIASGWGDGTLNFSMMPSQFDWISQSLDFDFENGGLDDPSKVL